MEQSKHINAPSSEAVAEAILNPDHEEAKQKVAEYAERFLEYRTRYKRTLVKTRQGLQSGDQDIKKAWGIIETHMNGLLDKLYEQNVYLGLETLGETAPTEEDDSTVVKPPSKTIRIQMQGEPIPEYHDEWIVVLPKDDDLGRGRKFEI